jgi:hypothetical protein
MLVNNAEGNQDGAIRLRDVHPHHLEQMSNRGPKHKHIDGDLIKRWMEAGEDVETLVCDDTDEEVGKLFKNLALDVDGKWRVTGSGSGRRENSELYKCIGMWMAEVLMPVL